MRKVYFILMFVVLTSVSVFVYVILKADSSQMQGYKWVRFEHGEWPSSVGPVQLMYVHLEIRRNLYIRLESQMSLFVFSHRRANRLIRPDHANQGAKVLTLH